MSFVRPIVWSIAGSDSGGGAGLQADNLTIYDLACHPCNVITSVTAQNSVQVTRVETTDIDMLESQLSALKDDLPAAAIKIGLLVSTQQIQFVADWLKTHLADMEKQQGHSIPVIWDPVMVASSGDALIQDSGEADLSAYLSLAKRASLITPNTRELEALCQIAKLSNHTDIKSSVQSIAAILDTNVLVTGGDVESDLAYDCLAARDIEHTSADYLHQLIGFSSQKQQGVNNHGTGCTYSSAIASTLALGYPMLDAICIAKAYINQGLRHSYQLGKGQGPLSREGWPKLLADFPKITLENYSKSLSDEASKAIEFASVKTPLKVYPVTQSLKVLEEVLKAGALTAQLRIKTADDSLESTIQKAVSLGKQFNAQVFINDHWELAIKHNAFGVHLGQEDALKADLNKIAEAGLALGLSSHGYFEMFVALEYQPSYLAIGHIFPTPTKDMPSLPQGLNKLAHFNDALKETLPLVAIGGIDATNMSDVAATGVRDIAVVRAVEQSKTPGQQWQLLQKQWRMLQNQGEALK